MPPNRFESEVESFLEGSHGDRTHIKRADHHTVTPLCGTLLCGVLDPLEGTTATGQRAPCFPAMSDVMRECVPCRRFPRWLVSAAVVTGGAFVGCVGGLVVTGGAFVGGFWARLPCFVLSVVSAVSCGRARAAAVVPAVSCGRVRALAVVSVVSIGSVDAAE